MKDIKETTLEKIFDILEDIECLEDKLNILSACMMSVVYYNDCTDYTSESYDEDENKYTLHIHIEDSDSNGMLN